MIKYYVYMITFSNGEYYIGRRKFRKRAYETLLTPLNDGYWGSGTGLKEKAINLWIQYQINDGTYHTEWTNIPKYGKHEFTEACLNNRKIEMKKEIITVYDNADECNLHEKTLIGLCIRDPLCLNRRVGT